MVSAPRGAARKRADCDWCSQFVHYGVMDEQRLRDMLAAVHAGSCSVNDAVAQLRALPFEDLGFAKIDHHRAIRCGFPEVIYCEGKSAAQVAEIFDRSAATGPTARLFLRLRA